jgi:hypothetical protein
MFLSTCRNCNCLHYYGNSESEYVPIHCYCPKLLNGASECLGYEPRNNLEYLEYLYDKKRKGEINV